MKSNKINLKMEINLSKKVTFQEKLFFTKHLSTMLQAGIPLAEALETLQEQNKKTYLEKILIHVVKQVNNGLPLASAFKKYPKVFDDFYLNLVSVGEESGTLEESLNFLAKQLSKDYSLRKKIQGAMLYPAIVFGATFFMSSFISLFILPQLVGFFDTFNFELPFPTRVLLATANFMKNYGVFGVIGFAISLVGLYAFSKLPKIRYQLDAVILRTPIFGKLMTYNQLAGFTRNLGVLLQSGLPITRALEVTGNTLSNLQYKRKVLILSRGLEKGTNLNEMLEKKNYREFPPIVSKMISVGERTGNLDKTLLYLNEFYEEEIDNVSKNLSNILEPILLIGIGLVVGFVALAIISPIYELTGSIR